VAILSTASGAIIAPTSLCTENIVRPFFPNMSDRQFLLTLRVILVSFTCAPWYSPCARSRRCTTCAERVHRDAGGRAGAARGRNFLEEGEQHRAILSAGFGLVAWLIAAFTAADAIVPPPLVGLGFSVAGMLLGSVVPRARAADASPGYAPLDSATMRAAAYAAHSKGAPCSLA